MEFEPFGVGAAVTVAVRVVDDDGVGLERGAVVHPRYDLVRLAVKEDVAVTSQTW